MDNDLFNELTGTGAVQDGCLSCNYWLKISQPLSLPEW